MKRKQPRPVAPVAVDPNAEVFAIGDRCEILRPNLWSGYEAVVNYIDGGKYTCAIWRKGVGTPTAFHADIPAAELKKL